MAGTKFKVKKFETHTQDGVDYEYGAEINQDFPIEAPEGATGKLVVNNDLEVSNNVEVGNNVEVTGKLTSDRIETPFVLVTGDSDNYEANESLGVTIRNPESSTSYLQVTEGTDSNHNGVELRFNGGYSANTGQTIRDNIPEHWAPNMSHDVWALRSLVHQGSTNTIDAYDILTCGIYGYHTTLNSTSGVRIGLDTNNNSDANAKFEVFKGVMLGPHDNDPTSGYTDEETTEAIERNATKLLELDLDGNLKVDKIENLTSTDGADVLELESEKIRLKATNDAIEFRTNNEVLLTNILNSHTAPNSPIGIKIRRPQQSSGYLQISEYDTGAEEGAQDTGIRLVYEGDNTGENLGVVPSNQTIVKDYFALQGIKEGVVTNIIRGRTDGAGLYLGRTPSEDDPEDSSDGAEDGMVYTTVVQGDKIELRTVGEVFVTCERFHFSNEEHFIQPPEETGILRIYQPGSDEVPFTDESVLINPYNHTKPTGVEITNDIHGSSFVSVLEKNTAVAIAQYGGRFAYQGVHPTNTFDGEQPSTERLGIPSNNTVALQAINIDNEGTENINNILSYAYTGNNVKLESTDEITIESNNIVFQGKSNDIGPRLHLQSYTDTSDGEHSAIQFSESTRATHEFGTSTADTLAGFDIVYNADSNELEINSHYYKTANVGEDDEEVINYKLPHIRFRRNRLTGNRFTGSYYSDRPNHENSSGTSIVSSKFTINAFVQFDLSKLTKKRWYTNTSSNRLEDRANNNALVPVGTQMVRPLVVDENGFVYYGNAQTSASDFELTAFTGAHVYLSDVEIPKGSSVVLLENKQVSLSTEKESKICCGIASQCSEVNSHPHRDLRLSMGGLESEAPEGKYICIVFAVGDSRENQCEGFNVCNENGDIQPGDLLVTSSTPGYLMKQSDDLMRSSTVGKAMENVVFNEQGQATGVYGYLYCG